MHSLPVARLRVVVASLALLLMNCSSAPEPDLAAVDQAEPSDCAATSQDLSRGYREDLDEVVTVYLICGDDFDNPKPVERVVAAGGPPERTAAIQLFLGVTPAEREAGWQSQFSSYTAHIVRGVELEGGVVILDLSPAFETAPNYATFSTGRTVLEQIRGTLLRMPQVEGVEFVIDGERWCGWNSGDCAEVPRPFLRR